MFPEVLECVDQRGLQLVERRENAIGEDFAQMAEDLRSLVELWTVTWQIERMHASWPAHLATVMTARTIQHDPNGPLSQSVPQMSQKELQALAIHARQQQKDASAGGGLYRCIQPQPLILVLHDPRRTFPQWAPAPTQPGDQAKAALIQSHHPRRLRVLDQGSEVFLKAVCCSALAFLWRLRPVFHFTRCFLKSHHNDLPFL
jgi:hypothetical protein